MHLPSRDLERQPASSVALPWDVPSMNGEYALCDWCGRAIYVPAVPCSVRPVDGLMTLETAPGLGDRCKWEMHTREVASDT